MKYINSDYQGENVLIRRTPQNSKEAYNKLICLVEQAERRDPRENKFISLPLSKRRERILKMYWAFKRMEKLA